VNVAHTGGGKRRRKPIYRERGWRRPPIRFGFLHRVASSFGAAMRSGKPAPHWGIRMSCDDRVPSTGRDRQRRRRWDLTESIVLVMWALLARVDLRSLRVGHHAGRRRKHDFVGLSRFTIACWTGLSEETVTRVLAILRHAGLVHGPGWDNINVIRQPYDVDARGVREWHPAIRRLDLRFFVVLGFGPELHELRTRKRPATSADVERANAGREVRAAVETRALDAIARLFPNGPPDG
jgi:hypothetical protein